MAGRVVLRFLQTDQRYEKELEADKSIVAGREVDERYDLNLTHYFNGHTQSISRRHFKISNTSTGFFLTDLKSTNGTHINQEVCPAQRSYPLRNGDTIELAKDRTFQIDVSIEEDPNATEIVGGDIPEGIPSLELYLEKKDKKNPIFLIKRSDLPKWKLTSLESRLLNYFCEHRGRTCLYYDIASDVWDYPDMSYDAIRHIVRKLRQKLDQLSPGAGKHYLRAINGFGYKLVRDNKL
jgi:hypothetical protein